MDRGAVKTEGGNAAAILFGILEAFTTVEEVVNGLLAKVNYCWWTCLMSRQC